jgi:hypothetical protein
MSPTVTSAVVAGGVAVVGYVLTAIMTSRRLAIE